MADEKWDKIDALHRQNHQDPIARNAKTDSPLAPINQQIAEIRTRELDLIGRFQRNAIDRRAALAEMRTMHDAHLEATKHLLKRAIDVEKQRVDVVADKYIFHITEEFLRNLRELGLQNYESRMETLLQLNEVMSRLAQKAQAQDVPASIRETTLNNILKKYKEFSDRLMEDEIKLNK